MKICVLATICWLNAQLVHAASYSMISSQAMCVGVESSNELTYYQLPSEAELTPTELQEMKRILLRALSQYNKRYGQGEFHIGPLADYGVQYKVFLTNEGKKAVWINGFCKDTGSMYSTATLTTLPVSVFDGGSCYFNTTINLVKHKAIRVTIHGFA